MSETEVIAQLKSKDFNGLQQLLVLYGAHINKTVYSILKEPFERCFVDDAMNEILFYVWNSIDAFDSQKSSFPTWLLLIARSKSIDFKRQIRRRSNVTLDEVEPKQASNDEPVLEKEEFLSLIDTLDELDQSVFLYYYFYQYSPVEIGEFLTLSTDAVYQRLSRGRKKLEKKLGGHSNG